MSRTRDDRADGITRGRATIVEARGRSASFGARKYDSAPPPFRITERDVAMLQAIARFRFLTADLAQRIVGGSERGVRNRLRTARGARLPRSPSVSCHRATRVWSRQQGSAAVWPITATPSITASTGPPRTTRRDHFLAHTLAVAETMLHFELATRDDAVRLVDHHELAAGHAGANARRTRSILSARDDPPP